MQIPLNLRFKRDQRGDPRIMWSVKHQHGPTVPGITRLYHMSTKIKWSMRDCEGNQILRYINAVREPVRFAGSTGPAPNFVSQAINISMRCYFRGRTTKRASNCRSWAKKVRGNPCEGGLGEERSFDCLLGINLDFKRYVIVRIT